LMLKLSFAPKAYLVIAKKLREFKDKPYLS
jgi:hypothetical protein